MTKDWKLHLIPMLIGGIGYAFIFSFDLKLGIGVFFIVWASEMKDKCR
jgi:hypothetical protein